MMDIIQHYTLNLAIIILAVLMTALALGLLIGLIVLTIDTVKRFGK